VFGIGGKKEKMRVSIFPSEKVVRIKYRDDKELKAFLDAIQGLNADIKVNAEKVELKCKMCGKIVRGRKDEGILETARRVKWLWAKAVDGSYWICPECFEQLKL